MARQRTEPATGKKESKPTEYRLLRKIDLAALETAIGAIDPRALEVLTEAGIGDTAEMYILVPATYTGNVKKKALDEFGEGDYAQVAASSFNPFPAYFEPVARFKR